MLRKALVVAFTVTMVPYGGAFQLSLVPFSTFSTQLENL